MTQFRKHRGGLEESLQTAFSVCSRQDIVDAYNTDFKKLAPQATVKNLTTKYQGYDDRIGWDTHMIRINGRPYGFTDGPI